MIEISKNEVACVPGPRGEDVWVMHRPPPLPVSFDVASVVYSATYEWDGHAYWHRLTDDVMIPLYRPREET